MAKLFRQPGFLVRRAHQISNAIFKETVGQLGVTATQYAALLVLRHREGLDRIDLARRLGIDRTTAALVVRKLEEKALIVRVDDVHDRRRRVIVLTARGERLMAAWGAAAEAAQAQALSVFTAAEAQEFLHLLSKISDTFNQQARSPLEADGLDR